MTLEAFRQALVDALAQHFLHASVTITESRGVALTGRAELNPDTFVAVYFNSLTGKTSYALIHHGQRVAGYDNYKFWHYHPSGGDGPPCALRRAHAGGGDS